MMINEITQLTATIGQQDALPEITDEAHKEYGIMWEKENKMKVNAIEITQIKNSVNGAAARVSNIKPNTNFVTDKNEQSLTVNEQTTILNETNGKDERQVTDEMIIQKVLMGDKDAFSELVVQYQRLVFHVAHYYLKNADDVDDAAQEVFLRSYKSLSRYNPEFKFSTWLSSITKNYCLDVLRKKNKIALVDIDDCVFLTAEHDTPEELCLQSEEREQLHSAVAGLPVHYQEVVNLYHEQGLCYLDIADRMSKPLSIVKNRLMRARRMLQKSLVINELHG